jgi:hypothetical protein
MQSVGRAAGLQSGVTGSGRQALHPQAGALAARRARALCCSTSGRPLSGVHTALPARPHHGRRCAPPALRAVSTDERPALLEGAEEEDAVDEDEEEEPLPLDEDSADEGGLLPVVQLALPPPTRTKVKNAEYVQSCVTLAACPAAILPEFAVIGRSNVGKSSLINMLTNSKHLAHVSKEPGARAWAHGLSCNVHVRPAHLAHRSTAGDA